MLPDVFLQGELSGAFNCRGFLKNAGERIKAFDLLFLHEIVRILGAMNLGGRINYAAPKSPALSALFRRRHGLLIHSIARPALALSHASARAVRPFLASCGALAQKGMWLSAVQNYTPGVMRMRR